MRLFRTIIAFLLPLTLLLSCDVHEFPDAPETRPHVIRLVHSTELPQWHMDYSLDAGITSKGEAPTKTVMPEGHMRYIIRTYPVTKKGRAANAHVQEFKFTRDICGGYDEEFVLDLIPGDYQLMVWTDLTETHDEEPYYNPADFGNITFYRDEHCGNTDYRDAFRGVMDISVGQSIMDELPDTTVVDMERPLAKYEFLTTDLHDFLTKEQTRVDLLSKAEAKEGSYVQTKVSLDDYDVMIFYPGFMPCAYSMFTDKAVNSSTGVRFPSRITRINDTEASVGFDYVFVNHKQASVSVQVGIYSKDGIQLSLSNPIEVPLKRSHHTILRGTFLTQKASGGIIINPDFDGDHNIIL